MDWMIRGAMLCAALVGPVTASAQSPSPPAAPWQRVHAPTATERSLLRKISAVDAEADALTRCLHYPDPPDVHWNRGSVVAICHQQFDPLPTLADLRAKLDKEGPASLDRYFNDLRNMQASPATEWKLDYVVNSLFDSGTRDVRELADAWLALSPDDEWALLASGMQYGAAAQEARGNAVARETSDARFARMAEIDATAQIPIQRVLEKDPGLTPAVAEMLWIEARASDPHVLNDVYAALAAHPGSTAIHRAAGQLLQKKWFGSDAMIEAEEQAMLAGSKTYPMLLHEYTRVEWSRHLCGSDCLTSEAVVESVNKVGPHLGPLRDVVRYRERQVGFASTVIWATQVLRFSRQPEPRMRTARGVARHMLGDATGARADAELALAQDPGFEPAMILMQSIETMPKGPLGALQE